MEKHIFKKKYGQNFLTDDNILKKIYSCITPTPKDLIIEIGPGSGNLTKYLQKYNATIICFEIDTTLKKILDTLENEKTKIIYTDFLQVELNEILKEYTYDNLYFIANIPYYITTPIIEKIISSNVNPQELILMVQKEVALRFSAKPQTKEYGFYTVWLNYHFQIKKLFDVSKNCFYPAPNVDSAIISLKTKNYPPIDKEKFRRLIETAFKYKRKTLKNNLKSYNLEKINDILIKNNYSLNNRAEDIPLEIYLQIVAIL